MACYRFAEHEWEPLHPTWMKWMANLSLLCPFNSPIHTNAARPDAQAICTTAALCQEAGGGWELLENVILFVLDAESLHWGAPIMHLWYIVKDYRPEKLTPAIWRKAGEELESIYGPKKNGQAMKIQKGVLRYTSQAARGASPLRNPAERGYTMSSFYAMAEKARESQITAKALAKAMTKTTIELRAILLVLEDTKNGVYSGSVCYRNLRLCRCLLTALGKNHADTIDDWGKWKSMSAHVRATIAKDGLESYQTAIKFRNAMRMRTKNPNYSFGDAALFICLQNGEKED